MTMKKFDNVRLSGIGLSFGACAVLGVVCYVVQHVSTPTMSVQIEEPPLNLNLQSVPAATIRDGVSGKVIGYSEGNFCRPGPRNVKIEPWIELQGEGVPQRIVDAATNELIGLTLPSHPRGTIPSGHTARTEETVVARFEPSSMGRTPFRIKNPVTCEDLGYTDQVYPHMLPPTVVKLKRQGSDRFEIIDVATHAVIGHTSAHPD